MKPQARLAHRTLLGRVLVGSALLGVALLGCGGPSMQSASVPPYPREPAPPGLYGDAGVVAGMVGSNTPPLATSSPTAPPVASSGDISTHGDGESDLIAITGGSAKPAPTTGDPGDAGEVVARLQPSFRDCFDAALKSEPKAGGSVTLDVLLLPTGMVKSITPKNNAGLSQTVVKCATGVVEKARFRAPEGGAETHIEIPLKFRPRS
jgi:hypothetical protein